MKKLGFIGIMLFIFCIIGATVCGFPAAVFVGIACGAYGLAVLVVDAWKRYKSGEKKLDIALIVSIVLAIVGGVLVALGGGDENIFETVAGLVVALVSIVLGFLRVKNT